ncbi:hypothetical protein [Marinobacterium mangrovicola]|uniref:Uncharacterized protein n=1 Tax=Marinobacterium mangrovicola TaxID=1476959 RepID=A0A4R1G9F3_9GAMM|nr:hypothetical protein [Marinobacterium mangrovicola]TCK03145.1 hypothetical protein CLV83_4204 [Marinobacterium mangrovicola]
MIRSFLLLILLLIAAYFFFPNFGEKQPDGVLIDTAPRQLPVSLDKRFQHKGYTLEALAGFELEARVLGLESYRLDRESDLAKYDLALGWQRMSDNRVLEKIDITQSGRWYRWKTEQFPIPRREIERSSANMHMVPANDWIEKQIGKLGPGDLVRIRGYLIKAESADGWHWKSSLTREDTGNGACELVYVESFERL